MKNYYKIAFCGLGSIGGRHLRNTVRYLREHQYDFQIDAIRSDINVRVDDSLAMYITNQYSYQDSIPHDYDIIFITNPTACHVDSIEKYKDCTGSMFIEKPVSNTTDYDFSRLPKELICYVACPLRYTGVLQYVKEHIDCDKAYSVRAICSTYLPDWHPHEDYRDSYSADKDMGGGVAIDLIHEWDYLVWLFGRPDKVNSLQKKISNLEINSEDIAVYIGCSSERIYELHLDYFGRDEIRNLEMYFPDETVVADIHNGFVQFCKKSEQIDLSEERDDYQMKEIAHFFDIIQGKCKNDNDIAEAMKTLKVAKGEA